MLIPCTPLENPSFPKHFWLGLALAATIWGLLSLGTAIG